MTTLTLSPESGYVPPASYERYPFRPEDKVSTTGDTMTGQLTLPGGGTGNNAATVQQVVDIVLTQGGINFTRHTANVAVADRQGIIADTTGGPFTITLPPSPVVGTQCVIADGGDWAVNNLTVNPNGKTIEGDGTNLIMNVGGVSVMFVYDGTTWEVFVQAGAHTGTSVTTSGSQTLTNKTIDAPVINSATVTGTLNFSGIGPRITGDFSNATASSRVQFQSSTLNGFTAVGVVPNGSSTTAALTIDNESTATNSSAAALQITNNIISLISTTRGSGTLLPIGILMNGITVSQWTTSGHFVPGATNSYDMGSTTLRWRNIYTQDLHLSNGIGDYTIVEGEEELYLVNNKNKKTFKFALIEVDPKEVPKRSEEA